MTNNVRKIRFGLGWSQRELAQKANTSQQQIQRIEAGKQAAKLTLATAICSALGKPVAEVFPGAGKAWDALKDDYLSSRSVPEDALENLRETGIEADLRRYTLKVLLRGHEDPLFFPLLSSESDRIFRRVQEEDDDLSQASFVVFDSDQSRVAINLRAAMFLHFLWDADIGTVISGTKEEPDSMAVEVYLAENQNPIVISAEAESLDHNDPRYLNHIFDMLDCSDLAPTRRFHIEDADGESAFLRVGDITLLKASLWLLDPDERMEDDDTEEGDDDLER